MPRWIRAHLLKVTSTTLAVLEAGPFEFDRRAVLAGNGAKKLGPLTLDIDFYSHEGFGS